MCVPEVNAKTVSQPQPCPPAGLGRRGAGSTPHLASWKEGVLPGGCDTVEMLGRAWQAYKRPAAPLIFRSVRLERGTEAMGDGRGLWGWSRRRPGFEASGGEALPGQDPGRVSTKYPPKL